MKILIAIPSFDFVCADFAMSLAALLSRRAYDRKLRREVDLALANCKGSLIHHARNVLMQEALDVSATHIFFLDSDMVVPPDTLDRLIGHHVPIVGADYVRRVAPHNLNGTPAPGAMVKAGLAPMLTLPFGCILISLKVLDSLPRPWFRYDEGPDDASTQSEDTYFCNQARRAGHTIWNDVSLTKEVGHCGMKVFRHG